MHNYRFAVLGWTTSGSRYSGFGEVSCLCMQPLGFHSQSKAETSPCYLPHACLPTTLPQLLHLCTVSLHDPAQKGIQAHGQQPRKMQVMALNHTQHPLSCTFTGPGLHRLCNYVWCLSRCSQTIRTLYVKVCPVAPHCVQVMIAGSSSKLPSVCIR